MSKLLYFMIGGVTGGMIAWSYAKKKYEQIAQEEIDSVKEIYSRKENNKDTYKKDEEYIRETELMDNEPEEDTFSEKYEKAVEAQKRYSGVDMNEKPYVISPEEFDEIGYETISLYYYVDGVVADRDDNIIDNVDDIIGNDSLGTFGQYEDDSVYVRNDALKCDYEILRAEENFEERMANKYPHSHREV